MDLDTLKIHVDSLNDSDLIDLLDHVSLQVKRRNEAVVGKIALSADPVQDIKKAFEALGLNVDSIYEKRKKP